MEPHIVRRPRNHPPAHRIGRIKLPRLDFRIYLFTTKPKLIRAAMLLFSANESVGESPQISLLRSQGAAIDSTNGGFSLQGVRDR
jgi:hypothetical protein